MKTLKFFVLDGLFSLHRLKVGTSIPKALFASPFFSVSQTADELSIVAPEALKIDAEKTEAGWSALKVAGPLPFSETGILADIAATLAKANISIFAISTFDTDYVLVKNENLKAAKEALSAAGHKFGRTTNKETQPDEGFHMESYHSLLEKQIPLISQLITEKIGPAALTTLRSETAIAAAVGGLYEFLPTPVRLVVNRELFVNFCVRNLDKIIPEAPQIKTKSKQKK